jgi:dihydropyrimidinase
VYRLIIKGGLVVTPNGAEHLDIGVVGERIETLAPARALTTDTERVVDATGLIVTPGGIDPHVHSGQIPGRIVATSPSAPPSVVSRAALFGGTTTIVDFAYNDGEETLHDTAQLVTEAWNGICHCDYTLHIRLKGRLKPEGLAEIPDLIRAGYPSFKIFTTDIRPDQSRRVPVASIRDLMEVTAGRGLIAIHAEDDDLVKAGYERYFDRGDLHRRNLSKIHSSLSEELATKKLIRIAREVEGSALYFLHVGAAGAVEAVRDARQRDQAVYGEVLHAFLLRNEADYLEPDGIKYHTYPSLKSIGDVAAQWSGVCDGTLSTLATDALIVPYEQKVARNTLDGVVGGHTGIEPRMAIGYTEIVSRRRLGLAKFAEFTSTNAARILGLYPRKGVIAVGSDADLTILDPNEHRVIDVSMLHESNWTPWQGWEVTAWPVSTILRGRMVVDDGKFFSDERYGQFIPRKLEQRVLGGAGV